MKRYEKNETKWLISKPGGLFLTRRSERRFAEQWGNYRGYIKQGAEVGNASGWCDFNYAINARKNKDGSYCILNEENAFAKVVHYFLPPDSFSITSIPNSK